MREKQGYIDLNISYNGLHKFFGEMFKKGVVEIGLEVKDLTINEAELIEAVGSEYLYLIMDMETKGKMTNILFLNEVD